jgi:hypothetical protein
MSKLRPAKHQTADGGFVFRRPLKLIKNNREKRARAWRVGKLEFGAWDIIQIFYRSGGFLVLRIDSFSFASKY